MNTKHLLMLIAVMLFFISCEKDNTDKNKALSWFYYVTIVKFKDPSYAEHLIVSNYNNDNSGSLLMRGNLCERTQWLTSSGNDEDGTIIDGKDWNFSFPERIHNPFWALPDGWYLTDWAWFGLSTAYPYDGNTILTDVTVDNYREHGASFFDKSVPHTYMGSKDNIFEVRYVPVADIMGYSYPDGNYPSYDYHLYDKKNGHDTIITLSNQYFYHIELAHTKSVSNVHNCLCEIADDLDEYWALLQSQISTIINNGDLDKLEKFDILQLYDEHGEAKK